MYLAEEQARETLDKNSLSRAAGFFKIKDEINQIIMSTDYIFELKQSVTIMAICYNICYNKTYILNGVYIMLKAKITTIGNSTGLVLPKEALGKLKVHKGDYLYFIETPNGYELVAHDKEFIEQMKLAQIIMHDDKNVLKALAECNAEEHEKNKKNK